jgi:hypothetical protein
MFNKTFLHRFTFRFFSSTSWITILAQLFIFYQVTMAAGQAALPGSDNAILQHAVRVDRTLGGTLAADTTLDAAEPWRIVSNLVVPADVTLTIEAGATIYVDPNIGIEVREKGCLIAIGQSQRHIRMTPDDGQYEPWGGITFNHSREDNLLSYIDMQYGDSKSYAIYVNESRGIIENMTWTNSNKTVIEVDHPMLIVRGCIFPNVNGIEPVHGQSLVGEEYFILDGNTFGKPTGYNDVIDFSDCELPGPIFQVYNNIFLGGGDDGLDLDGCDAHIEGNYFTDFHKGHTGSSTSNAVATGFGFEKITDIMVVRNIFYSNDHGVMLKEGCYMYAENNVFVNSTYADINYSEWPDRDVTPGKGAYLDGNIFWNSPAPFDNQFAQPGNPDPVIIVNRCIIPAALHSLGIGNLDVDPLFVDNANDFHLQPSSPAIGHGPNGLDMGRYVASGASISGEPDSVSHDSTATLFIGGPGITYYQYCVNNPDGLWSPEIAVAEQPQIHLTGLQDGMSYTVYVRGKNFAGSYQVNPEMAVSRTWRVEINTRVEKDNTVPLKFGLLQNSPNPFNSSTTIHFEIPQACNVRIAVFNIQGRLMTILVNGFHNPGRYQMHWNANESASGIYYAQIQAGSYSQIIKMALIR